MVNWQDYPLARIQGIVLGLVVLLILVGIASFVSIVNIGGDEAGVVERKFGGGKLPSGNILAVDGENGIQKRIRPQAEDTILQQPFVPRFSARQP